MEDAFPFSLGGSSSMLAVLATILMSGYDQIGYIPRLNRNQNFGMPILVSLFGTRNFRITSVSGQIGTGVLIS